MNPITSARLGIKPANGEFGEVDVFGLAQEEDHHFSDIVGLDHWLALEAIAEVGALDQVSLDAAGTERVDVDVVGLELHGERTREAEKAVLAGDISGLVEVALRTGGAGDVHNAAFAARYHLRQNFASDQEGSGEIDALDAVPVGKLHPGDRFLENRAGVVDEKVHAAEARDQFTDCAGDFVHVGEVAGDKLAIAGGFRTGEQAESHALAGKGLENGQADAAAGAGEDGGFTGEGGHSL